jgi:Protein of unknown function (DUF4242)
MPRYLVERHFEVGEEGMPTVGRRSRQLVEQEFPEITWEHSHVVIDDDGSVRSFCVYAAPTEDIVHKHAGRLGQHKVKAIYEVAGDVTPADFPPQD